MPNWDRWGQNWSQSLKGEKSITKYLARIQRIEDILDSIDDPISHLEAILDGLPEDYNTLVSIISFYSMS